MIEQGIRVAVVDDNSSYAETTAGIAEEAGLVPLIISEHDGKFEKTDHLLERIRSEDCHAVICDHRLSHTPFASFSGAQFLSQLYQERIPGLLLSTFYSIDADTSIRLYRSRVPSVVDREVLDPDLIYAGLLRCEDELNGNVPPERQTWRTLVRVQNIDRESDTPVIEAILHNWDPDYVIRFPLTVIEDQKIISVLNKDLKDELRLFAEGKYWLLGRK